MTPVRVPVCTPWPSAGDAETKAVARQKATERARSRMLRIMTIDFITTTYRHQTESPVTLPGASQLSENHRRRSARMCSL